MKKMRYFIWILGVEATGFLSGLLSRKRTEVYGMIAKKPLLTPPGFLFPVVWTVLYGLMGISAARIAAAPESRGRSVGLNIFVVQLVFNFFWSLLFFNAQAYGLSLLWLLAMWVMIITMIVVFWNVDKSAAVLQIPYLLWVTYAAYLNYGVWKLNP